MSRFLFLNVSLSGTIKRTRIHEPGETLAYALMLGDDVAGHRRDIASRRRSRASVGGERIAAGPLRRQSGLGIPARESCCRRILGNVVRRVHSADSASE